MGITFRSPAPDCMTEGSKSSNPEMAPRARRRARVLAMQTLYEVDVSAHSPRDVLKRLAEEINADEQVADYADEIVVGIVHHRDEIDEQISRHARAWPLAQMSAVDRNLIRIAIYELSF